MKFNANFLIIHRPFYVGREKTSDPKSDPWLSGHDITRFPVKRDAWFVAQVSEVQHLASIDSLLLLLMFTAIACHPSQTYGLGDRSLQFSLSKVLGSRSFSDLRALTGSDPK